MQTEHVPRVALLVDTSTGWGRRLIAGVQNYVRKHRAWEIWIEAKGQDEVMRLPQGWAGDGVIARISTPAMARHLEESGYPVINVSGIRLRGPSFPRVTVNDQASARLAVEHFRERGFRNFAYCGPDALPYVAAHRRAFEEEVERLGAVCSVYEPVRTKASLAAYEAQVEALEEWIDALPKPAAVFVWATSRNRQVIEACKRRGIDIPEDVAVLGGDDDELLNELTTPPVSGILVPSEQIGYEAAAILDKMLSKSDEPTPEEVFLDPIGVETRGSTDTLAIDDPDVSAAVQYIREHASHPIQVIDVLRHVPVSRRVLERRFRRLLGRSPADEIRRIRLASAVRLLVNTELPIPEVAARSGFGTHQYLARIFGRQYGVSPSEFRNRALGR